MLNDEIISAVSRFFESGKGPSHDELTRLFKRAGLSSMDPADASSTVGKMKRCREVLSQALDELPEAGEKLVKGIIETIKARGGFRSSSPDYAGEEAIRALQTAIRNVGWQLGADGSLSYGFLESLDGRELTVALRSYVTRAQRGLQDAALVIGTGKDLLEATSRHVLKETTGQYPTHSNFTTTLFQAYSQLELKPPELKLIEEIGKESPLSATFQSLFLLGVSVNRLRNSDGTGHGRPFLSDVSAPDARLATQAMGLISELLLSRLSLKK